MSYLMSNEWKEAEKLHKDAIKRTIGELDSTSKLVNRVYNYGMFPNAGTKKRTILSPLESPVVKGTIAGLMGAGLGVALGLFLNANQAAIHPLYSKLTSKQQMRVMVAETKNSMGLRARSFGAFGAIFASSECVIERYRAKCDSMNSVYAGMFTGGIVSARGGPLAMALGAAGMAAFSVAIEYYQHGFN